MSKFPQQVSIVEVGARDGLQNETAVIELPVKLAFIDGLVRAGLKRIEAGSFVSPKWVPQMADSAAVFNSLGQDSGATFSALTPNEKGMLAAIDAGVDEVAVFAAASESFSQRNINCSIEQSLERFQPVFRLARQHNLPVRGYVSCVMGCPYEGAISPDAVLAVSQTLLDKGCYEISLGDTIGTGTPGQTAQLLSTLLKTIPASKLAVHFHDTYGQASANIYAALQRGIATVDSAVAGLGGCPYAKGASGNVATEDVLYLLNGLGIVTGVDLEKLVATGDWICDQLNRHNGSKVGQALGGNC